MEAQGYPEDFDGILAGAPANYWAPLMTGMIVTVEPHIKGNPAISRARTIPPKQVRTSGV